MRLLIIFIFLTTNVFANDVSEIKNVVIHKNPKVYDNVIFLDKKDKKININESGFVLIPLKTSHYIIKRVYFNNIVILNPINIIIKKFCRVIITSPN